MLTNGERELSRMQRIVMTNREKNAVLVLRMMTRQT